MTGVKEMKDIEEFRIGFADHLANVISHCVSPQWIPLHADSPRGDDFLELPFNDRLQIELENPEWDINKLRRQRWERVR
jgi:hypothetical protein